MKKTVNSHVPTKVYMECEAAGKNEALILMNLFDVPFSLTKSWRFIHPTRLTSVEFYSKPVVELDAKHKESRTLLKFLATVCLTES